MKNCYVYLVCLSTSVFVVSLFPLLLFFSLSLSSPFPSSCHKSRKGRKEVHVLTSQLPPIHLVQCDSLPQHTTSGNHSNIGTPAVWLHCIGFLLVDPPASPITGDSDVQMKAVVADQNRSLPISQASTPSDSSSSLGDLLVGIDPDDFIDSCSLPDEPVGLEESNGTDIIGCSTATPSIPVEVKVGGRKNATALGCYGSDQLSCQPTSDYPPDTFYGLPTLVGALLKEHRGIDVLYG